MPYIQPKNHQLVKLNCQELVKGPAVGEIFILQFFLAVSSFEALNDASDDDKIPQTISS